MISWCPCQMKSQSIDEMQRMSWRGDIIDQAVPAAERSRLKTRQNRSAVLPSKSGFARAVRSPQMRDRRETTARSPAASAYQTMMLRQGKAAAALSRYRDTRDRRRVYHWPSREQDTLHLASW